MNPETDFRVRLYVGGVMVDEVWIDASRLDARQLSERAAERQAALATLADAAGKLFYTEIYDPGLPELVAYHRFGTDSAAMEHPSSPMSATDALEQLEEAVSLDSSRLFPSKGVN